MGGRSEGAQPCLEVKGRRLVGPPGALLPHPSSASIIPASFVVVFQLRIVIRW